MGNQLISESNQFYSESNQISTRATKLPVKATNSHHSYTFSLFGRHPIKINPFHLPYLGRDRRALALLFLKDESILLERSKKHDANLLMLFCKNFY
ncbi:hypothetical protein, partial [Psychrobacillus soli]|uniref:hypothetical protein n=1 Tax=Psychrobacillus soli TaxID=1543965 RepID=UPI001C8D1278